MKCKLCSQEFSFDQSRHHIFLKHGWKTKDYYDKFIKTENEDTCLFCSKSTTFISLQKGYRKTCNKHSFKLSQIAIKEQYGVDNISQCEFIKKKKEETCFKNHGVKSMLHSEARKILDQMNLENFGVKNLSSLDKTKQKIKNSFKEKYGTTCALQVIGFRNQYKQTCQTKYGCENPLQNELLRKKQQNSLVLNYGVEYPLQSNEIKERSKQTCMDHYGVDNFSKTPQGKELSRINFIRMIENQTLYGEPLSPRVGDDERLFLNDLQQYTVYNIIRNDISFRYMIGRFPDGHIPELKLFIQFDEHWHTNKYHTQNDIDCTLQLASLGYIVFRVSEKDWTSNKEKIIQQFQTLIEELK